MTTDMSKRTAQRTGSRHMRKPVLVAAAAIGMAGIVSAAPGAAWMAAPQAQAAPVNPAPQQQFPGFGFFGDGGLSAALLDPFFDIAGAIPFVNIFIGNGVDGTAANPNGGDAGIFAGNGGNGFSRTIAGTGNGGNGGNAGLFLGDGGNGGNGAPGINGLPGTNPTTDDTAAAGTAPGGGGADGLGLQNGGNGAPGVSGPPPGADGGNGGNGGAAGSGGFIPFLTGAGTAGKGGNGGAGGPGGTGGNAVPPARQAPVRAPRV